MGVRKLRIESEATLMERLALPIAAADAAHEAVDSPAMLLQQRLDDAVAVAPWGGRPEPVIRPWSAPARLAILVGGAAGSWVVAVAVIRALI